MKLAMLLVVVVLIRWCGAVHPGYKVWVDGAEGTSLGDYNLSISSPVYTLS